MNVVNQDIHKVPFKVSARTARLIGRENIATSKGAIIELVKNCSDADSAVSLIYFENKFAEIPQSITDKDRSYLIGKGITEELILELYELEGGQLNLRENPSIDKKDELRTLLRPLVSLYIIDAGEGMTQTIISDYWMTIGTDNKAYDVFTKSGKVKAGAKGIGRFALDKLGDTCEMITKFNAEIHTDADADDNPTSNIAYKWVVDWRDFEGAFKTIENVNATLQGYTEIDFAGQVKTSCPVPAIDKIIDEFKFENGTILKISNLREAWIDYNVEQLYSDLQVLVPPEEGEKFKIYVFAENNIKDFGLVEGSVCDDYDFKLVAKADDKQNVTYQIFRNEYDLSLFDPIFYKRPVMSMPPFTKEDFVRGHWIGKTTFGKLAPGLKELDEDDTFKKIGPFEFTFYFMKRTYSDPDLEKFNYRRFASNERKEWLNKYGGIKLFRDSFRVRPYGESNNSSFDWLGLGARKTRSPAAPSKIEGGYKVEAENIAGGVTISRIANIDFEDKSSREGLQENKSFQVFKEIIQGIIGLFEEDRALIAREMLLFYNEKNSDIKDREQAERLVQTILKRKNRDRDKQRSSDSEPIHNEGDNSQSGNANNAGNSTNDNNLFILAELNKEKDEIIEKLEDEQKILRGLASSGIVIASFTHELGNLNDIMGSRIDDLEYLIKEKLPPSAYNGIPNFLNPYEFMAKMRKQDLKLQNWLKFSLTAARKDKRKRKKVYLASYFSSLSETWNTVLANREITFNIELNGNEALALRVFEIDLDSIFNNLIVNSIDAFIAHTEIINRTITISLKSDPREIIIDYLDNGPGLSEDIDKPEKIFNALFTTKRNKHTLEEEGTGLGMWLVSSIVTDNDGTKKILFPSNGTGFGLRISLPKKYLTE